MTARSAEVDRTKKIKKPTEAPRKGFRALLVKPPLQVAGALALIHIALGLLTFDPTVFTGGDNAAYLSLANSLLHNHNYSEIYDPASPAHTQYPPVYPLLIALGLVFGLKSWVALKFEILVLSTVAVVFSYLWLRKRREPEIAFGVSLILAIAPGVLELSHVELSDVPFWAFTMIALWAFEHLRSDERARFAVGIVAVVLSYFTRSAGLPLIIAVLAWFGWRRC